MLPDDTSFTPVSEIGEFGLIGRIDALIGDTRDGDVVLGIGDDAAVVDAGGGRAQLITTDALIEWVHFDRTFTPLEMLGFKSIAVNVSDITAMNGFPRYAVVALGLPNRFSVEMVEALYRGMKRACDAYDVRLVGGDTTASQVTVISVTVIGEAASDRVCYRSGARPGDLICLSGDVGAGFAGLRILLEEKQAFKEAAADFAPNLQEVAHCVERQLLPQARLDLVREWARLQVKPSALIDVSDGVASEVHHLCSRGAVGARIEEGKLPMHHQSIAVAERFGETPSSFALHGGEDYQLLFTLPEDELARCASLPTHVIGEITEPANGIQLVSLDGEIRPLEAQGFRHF